MPMKLIFPYWTLLIILVIGGLVVFSNYWWCISFKWESLDFTKSLNLPRSGSKTESKVNTNPNWGVLNKWCWIKK